VGEPARPQATIYWRYVRLPDSRGMGIDALQDAEGAFYSPLSHRKSPCHARLPRAALAASPHSASRQWHGVVLMIRRAVRIIIRGSGGQAAHMSNRASCNRVFVLPLRAGLHIRITLLFRKYPCHML